MNGAIQIRRISPGSPEIPDALALVWEVFLEFEAPDYSEEGIREFRDYIEPSFFGKRMEEGLLLWGGFDGERIVGVIAVKSPIHVSLLFVDKACHRQGIARSLYETALNHYREETDHREATVHSSPYARGVYARLGFVPTGSERTVNGLRFIPMRHIFR